MHLNWRQAATMIKKNPHLVAVAQRKNQLIDPGETIIFNRKGRACIRWIFRNHTEEMLVREAMHRCGNKLENRAKFYLDHRENHICKISWVADVTYKESDFD